MPQRHNDTRTRFRFVYAILALITGTITILSGLILFLNGVTGRLTWIVKSPGATSELSNAAPGVVFVLAGIYIIYLTRFEPEPPGRTPRKGSPE